MQASIRAFFFHADGSVEPVPEMVLHDLRADRVQLPQHAGKRLRYAIVRVSGGDGEAQQATPMWCGILHLDEQGRQDRGMISQRRTLTEKTLADSLRGSRDRPRSEVIDARGHFSRRQLHNTYCWIPTDEDLEGLRRLMVEVRDPRPRLRPFP